MSNRRSGRNVLVLWRYSEAEELEGQPVARSIGSQMKDVRPGDTLFVVATRDSELFLLGVMQVGKVRRTRRAGARLPVYEAISATRSRPFRILPLSAHKWKLRFESEFDRLSRGASIAMQLRKHRFLTPDSAGRLRSLLDNDDARARLLRRRLWRVFEREGRALQRMVSVRERDPRVRRHAIERQGRACRICGLDFERSYGRFARDCVHVHHLNPLGSRSRRGAHTLANEVLVVCPNCHVALHRSGDAGNWRRLRAIWEERNA
jgi:hypothetical protein